MMFIRLIKIEFIVNDHWCSDSQYYSLDYYGECINLFDFYALVAENFSIEN